MRCRTRFTAKLAAYFPLAILCCLVSLACLQLSAQGRTGDKLSPGKGNFIFLDRAQGKHRFERGMNFYETVKRQAGRMKVQQRWKLETVPGVEHSNAGMAGAAAEVLFGPEGGGGKVR